MVAVKLWEKLHGALPAEGDDVDDGEPARAAEDLSTTMNALGNCCLLEKSFNIAKGAEPLRAFLERVHELKNGTWTVADWAANIGFASDLVDPTGKTAADVRVVVEQRTASMKTELKEYIDGTRQRVDV